jgi:hypothetical protein
MAGRIRLKGIDGQLQAHGDKIPFLYSIPAEPKQWGFILHYS